MSDDWQRECELIQQLYNTPELLSALESAKETELKLQKRFREDYSAELVRAAILLTQLRQRAKHKFLRAAEMWFHRIGFEQSTAEAVAMHKAKRFQDVELVHDLCSGIGMDSIALNQFAKQVVAVDISPLASLYTQLNADAYEVKNHIETRNANVEHIEIAGVHVHIDPDRRVGKSRAIRLEDYTPSLEYLQNLTRSAAGGAIKLSPASNFGGKFADAEIELISLNGECKEATVWFGDRQTEHAWRATILPAGYTIAGDPLFARAPIKELGKYLYDPDPAIVRSGLIDLFCEEQHIARLDDAEEYLTSDSLITSPAVSAFEVEVVLSNNEKEIRRYFRDANFGEVEIKCRHIPTDADKLRKKLSLEGNEKATLIIARLQGKTKAIICRRVANESHN